MTVLMLVARVYQNKKSSACHQ